MDTIAFIGGGNMATAIIGGLLTSAPESAMPTARSVLVVDPDEAARKRLSKAFGGSGLRAIASADASLATADLVVWAIKPAYFRAAAAACVPHVSAALHLSVMAGIRSETLAASVGSERIVRAMPNTPALIGRGIAGLFAGAAVSGVERDRIDALLAPTGERLWVERETDLDAITALSGSGPAYVFYVAEAMVEAAVKMGLGATEGRRLALATLAGAAALAAGSADALNDLRQRVTSKGGTTEAALAALEAGDVKATFVEAILVAQRRAFELGCADA